MKAVILAAGEGLRMRPLTENKPKPLLKIGGKPLLEQIVSRLPEEVDELILVVGYLGDQIVNYCGKEFLGKRVRYIRQKEKLGTYHALKICEHLIGSDEGFFTLFADDIHGAEGIKECLKHEMALIVEKTNEPYKFGIVELNKDGSIADIVEKPEKPRSNLASTGVLLLNSKIFGYPADRHSNGEYYLTDSISKMLKDGHKFFAVTSSLWIPVGYPEDIARAEKILKKN